MLIGSGWILDWLRTEPPNHSIVVISAGVMTVLLFAAWLLMLRSPSSTTWPRAVWSLAFMALIVHIILAFWLAHGWSQQAAIEHVREVGGYGSAIVVNYLVAAVWGMDVLWWWLSPVSHSLRPRWMGWSLHGFLVFVMINATIIFGSSERRAIYACVWFVLIIQLAINRDKLFLVRHSPRVHSLPSPPDKRLP